MLDGHGADISILIDIELRILIEIPGLCHFCHSELNMEGIRVLKILDRHDLNLLSKKALCTVSRSDSNTTRKYRLSISLIGAQRRMRPSFCTTSLTGLLITLQPMYDCKTRPLTFSHHSDQGNQYRATRYQTLLARRGVVPSMSRKGNCYDNAPVESFFSSLKNELVHHRQFQNQVEARYAIAEYIEVFYNRQRLHQALGYRSPEEFEERRGVS